MTFTAADVPDQSGRTILVTGANTGLGFEAAKVLAARGARVLLGCRDKGKAEAAMRAISGAAPGADLAFLPLDQADLASVRRAAELAGREPRLDVLLNNAGVMTPPLMRTADGFELQFGVNHLGTFALTSLLLPKLAEAPAARVVVTSSVAHKRGRIDWDDLNAEHGYRRGDSYCQSKLANLLFLFELDRRLRAAGAPVMAVGCHPGVAMTELMRHVPGPVRALMPLIGLFFNSPAAGSWPALQAATSPEAKSGDYFGPQGMREMRGPSGPAKRTLRSEDPEDARRLWEVSVAMTGVDLRLPAAT
ncbi:MAG: SDR family NAD(P)-dependent oxidoreductase [Novosphingobium sp.]|nr:SDR family NAD(P)-dependent oxidoreductase [Novosphingobium sp.]